MRVMKMLGLIATLAMVAMAFVGVSSAMATTTALCEVDEEECPEGSIFPSGTTISAQLVKEGLTGAGSTLLGPNLKVEVTCYESKASGKTTTGLANPLKGKLESLTFGHCFHRTGISCTVTINSLGELTLLRTGLNLGQASVQGVLATVVCGSILRCVYKTDSMPMHASGTGLGGAAATLVASHAKLTEEKELLSVGCPSEGFFDAAYEITTPKEGYIST